MRGVEHAPPDRPLACISVVSSHFDDCYLHPPGAYSRLIDVHVSGLPRKRIAVSSKWNVVFRQFLVFLIRDEYIGYEIAELVAWRIIQLIIIPAFLHGASL